MLCPHCRSDSTRRSQRRGLSDQVLTLVGLRPWRCRQCDRRFHAWNVPVNYVAYAHCARCGNFDLERVSRERIAKGSGVLLSRLLHIPGYRCDHCRLRFFSIRPFRRIVARNGEDASATARQSTKPAKNEPPANLPR